MGEGEDLRGPIRQAIAEIAVFQSLTGLDFDLRGGLSNGISIQEGLHGDGLGARGGAGFLGWRGGIGDEVVHTGNSLQGAKLAWLVQ